MSSVNATFRFATLGPAADAGDTEAPVIIYTNPTEEEKAYLTSQLLIDEHTLQSALDPDEISRLEFEPSHIAAIIKRPTNTFGDLSCDFRVASVGAFLFDDRLVVVENDGIPLFQGGRPYAGCASLRGALLQLIYHAIAQFMDNVKRINHVSNAIEENIEFSLGNKALSSMFELQKSLVYYQSSAHANHVLLNRLRLNAVRIGFTDEEKEFLDDMIVENNQCTRLVEMYSSILTGMSDARVSIISNNLSLLIKKLTVISVVFMPLNIIASMGGMSEYTMITRHMPWPASYALFTLFLGTVGLVTWFIVRNIGIEERPMRSRHGRLAFLSRAAASIMAFIFGVAKQTSG